MSPLTLPRHLLTIHATRPQLPTISRYRALGVITCLLAAIQVAGILYEYDTYEPLWTMALSLRSSVVIAVGLWLAIAPPWQPTTLNQQRQGRLAATMALVLLLFTGLLMWLDVNVYAWPSTAIAYWLLLVATLAQSIALIRLGLVTAGATLLILQLANHIFSVSGVDSAIALTSVSLVYALLVVCGALLVRWWAGLVLAPAIPFLTTLFKAIGLSLGSPNWLEAAIVAGNLMLIAGLTAIYARSLEQAVATADDRAEALAAAQDNLESQNQTLRAQTDELQAVRATLETTVARQEDQIVAAVTTLRERSIELSALQTPIIKVTNDVLVAPLIGRWDKARDERLTADLLSQVERQRAAYIILDFTGISGMNEATAAMIQRLVQAARLLGCRCLLSGVNPEVAQLLVAMGSVTDQYTTAPDLAGAIATILGKNHAGLVADHRWQSKI